MNNAQASRESAPAHRHEGISFQNLSDALRVEEGSLYPSLHRMEEAGWIKARTITTEHNRRARAMKSRPLDDASSVSKKRGGGQSPTR
jgi:hypothetical protein